MDEKSQHRLTGGSRARRGFTIVELLIVIVVIAILASISVVAYRGVQARARDSKRQSDLSQVVKLLEIYRAENGGYPVCASNATYQVGTTQSGWELVGCLTPALIPKYTSSLPVDPVNVAPNMYWYAVGYKKTGTNTYDSDMSSNYIIGTNLDAGGPTYSGWGYTLNHLIGSSS